MTCPICGEPTNGPLYPHMNARHPRDEWREPRNVDIGLGRQICYALGIWPTDVISRATLRALLPPGVVRDVSVSQHLKYAARGSTGRRNRTTTAFQNRLYKYEQLGLLQRGSEFILIRDRRTLMDIALDGLNNPRHDKFLRIDAAARTVADQIRREHRPKVRAQRLAELAFIRSLMVAPDSARGSMRSGTKAVRLLPRGDHR